MSFFTKTQIEKIISCAFDAGEIADKFQKSGDFQVTKKPDSSNVTSADVVVSKFINQKLSTDFPEIPIICEEGNLREVGDIFWLIDPIDGTNSFIAGSHEYAVNIALIKNQKAVFGLIYAPSFEGGKMIFSDHENQVISQNKLAQKIVLEPQEFNQEKLRIITSTRTKDVDVVNYINQFHQNFAQKLVVEKLASAIKFFRILEDDADLYLHFRRSMEWDTAAGQALIELMGGKVKNLFSNEGVFSIGEEVIYKKLNFANQPFVSPVKNSLIFSKS